MKYRVLHDINVAKIANRAAKIALHGLHVIWVILPNNFFNQTKVSAVVKRGGGVMVPNGKIHVLTFGDNAIVGFDLWAKVVVAQLR